MTPLSPHSFQGFDNTVSFDRLQFAADPGDVEVEDIKFFEALLEAAAML